MTDSNTRKFNLGRLIQIITTAVLIGILFFLFVPHQEQFYLEKDIEDFTSKYYFNFALYASLIGIAFFIIYDLRKKTSTNELLKNILGRSAYFFFFFFFFQIVFIAFALYINRKSVKEEISVTYKILARMDEKYLFLEYPDKKSAFFLKASDYERITKNNNLSDFNEGDTINLKFEKGLLGIKFIK